MCEHDFDYVGTIDNADVWRCITCGEEVSHYIDGCGG